MPKIDGSLSTLVEPQFGHATVEVTLNISRSKRWRQSSHSNSNTGTETLLHQNRPPIYPRTLVLDSLSVSLPESLTVVLSAPTADALWRLRADLLEVGVAAESEVWSILADFHDYLDGLATTTSSRDFSHLASKLDISAISGVILERVAERGEDADRALRLLSGLLSEGLMALATRQHVKAWSGEVAAVHRTAAWRLYERLWRWTQRITPELPADTRRELIDRLMSPVRSQEAAGLQGAVVIGRLFQILLLWAIADHDAGSALSRDVGRGTDAPHD